MTHLSKYTSTRTTAMFFLFLTFVLPGQTQEEQIRKRSVSLAPTDGGSIQWASKASKIQGPILLTPRNRNIIPQLKTVSIETTNSQLLSSATEFNN